MTSSDFPPISKALIEKLDEIFPERSADVTDRLAAVMFRGGQRSVLRKLLDEYRRQTNKAGL